MVVIRNAFDLAADIEARVAAGHLLAGERLDPVRVVASSLGLAPNTVASAYRTLGERGILIGRGRKGTFVAARPPVAMPVDDRPANGLIDLTSGNPDRALLPDLAPAVAAIDSTHTLYGDPALDAQLAELLRADLAADDIDPSNLVLVSGALDGIERVLASQLRPGDAVGVEDPGYGSVSDLISAMRFRLVPMAVDRFGVTPASLQTALAAGVTATIFTPRASNPSGSAFDDGRSAALTDVLTAHPEVLIIEDDHAGPVAGQRYHSIVSREAERWATIRSMAKSLGPDLRLAVVAGDDVTVRRVAGRLALGPGWVSHLLQRIVAEILSRSDLAADQQRAAEVYATRRAAVVDVLAAGGFEVHGRSGFNVWVPVDDEAMVVAGMQRNGFAVRSGARFRHRSGPGVRLSTASSDLPVLQEAASVLVGLAQPRHNSRSA